MQVKHFFNSKTHTISFSIEFSDEDIPALYQTTRSSSTMTHTQFRILLPDCIEGFESLHPDAWALIVLLVVFPFVKKELTLSFGVSSLFAETYSRSGKQIYPINTSLESYTTNSNSSSLPSLCDSVAFNGRMHSFTTAAVLGPSSCLVAMNHWDSLVGERTSPYPEDALYYTLDTMEHKGYKVQMVKTDIQSLYEPYGFAHPLTSTVGCVLLSQALGFCSVHMGCHMDEIHTLGKSILEKKKKTTTHKSFKLDTNQKQSLQCVGFKHHQLRVEHHESNTDSPIEHHVPFWRDLFGVVQLHLDFPLCGVPDTMHVKSLAKHNMWNDVHYCIYARPKQKCGVCVECFYYDSLYNAIMKHQPVFEKVWAVSNERYPEASSCVYA